MFKRIKRIVKLSRKDPESVERLLDEQIENLPEEKAEFLGSGTEKEFKEQENEDKGLKGIFGL